MFDSMDITQSVLAGFFAGVAAGRFVPENPQQLLALLITMTRNKLLKQVEYQRRHRRDARRTQSLEDTVAEVRAADETPSQVVAGRELLREFRLRLTEEEQQLAERRERGRSWAEIAGELGGTPEGRRKQLERAFARVVGELGLDEEVSLTS